MLPAAILMLALAVVAGARAAPAQPLPAGAVGVDGVVARALSDNPELHALRADIDAARGRLRQAGCCGSRWSMISFKSVTWKGLIR
jgi:outer membrane protein TolC